MTIRTEDVRAVPLFRDIAADKIETLTRAFERNTLPAGHVLFRAGDVPTHFLLLVRGEVILKEGGEERFHLRPFAPIGELGALTGLPRIAEAVTAVESEIWSIELPGLMKLFAAHGDIAFPFYKNLLAIVSDKVRQDRRRLGDMRDNLIRTQKRMKQLRELVLAARETEISKPVFEALDELIERNRRAHYRVTPAPALPSSVRMEDGTSVRVIELSEGYLKLDLPVAKYPKETEWSGVLTLPTREILVSGKVLRTGGDGVVVKLDLLIDEYKHALQDYVTHLQMLDFVL